MMPQVPPKDNPYLGLSANPLGSNQKEPAQMPPTQFTDGEPGDDPPGTIDTDACDCGM